MDSMSAILMLLLSDTPQSSASSQGSTSSSGSWPPPAGNATVSYNAEAPFLQVLSNIDSKEIATVSQGRELFRAVWLSAPASRATLDGLGPLFNANSCIACHASNGRIAPYHEDGTLDDSFLFRLGNDAGALHPIYGGQVQTQATAGEAEANVTWVQEQNGTVMFVATPDLTADGFRLGPRIAPHLLGMGLLDLVSESTILEYADPNDSNNDGISGRAHWVTEEGEVRIGRFGWKAINSTLRTQNAGAMHQDMGLTTPVNPAENCTANQDICATEPNGGTPEVSEASLMAIVNFMTALGVPERRIEDMERFASGAQLFEYVGCAACHRPTMTTGYSEKFSILSYQTIYPYTDLLLHDMGENLSDGIVEKDAGAAEWRTPPLWGIGIVENGAGARFLHDGRAKTVAEAITHHGGEAENARALYMQLSDGQKAHLLEFLRGI